jgi:uncharacterized protein YacL
MSETTIITGVMLLLAVAGLLAVRLMRLSFRNLILGLCGAITGLLLGALLSIPLSNLPAPFNSILPIVSSILITLILIGAFVNQGEVLSQLMPFAKLPGSHPKPAAPQDETLVDTSVIIDGRIADIATAGFAPGHLLVPRFVLAELQNIADSDDAMRRGRGRRGLETLKALRENKLVSVDVIDDDVSEIHEVDAKLVRLGKLRKARVMTTDYNLNRVAQIEGVQVLNINELANAIRPVVLPGEEMLVKVVQLGKEKNQGVGYLADGTMIVVENGDKLIGKEVNTEVTRVFQTVAGKMIFAAPKKANETAKSKSK